jgi:hypothetical protein
MAGEGVWVRGAVMAQSPHDSIKNIKTAQPWIVIHKTPNG